MTAKFHRCGRRSSAAQRRLAALAEGIEPRLLLAGMVFNVTNTNDHGNGSLRQAILNANATPDHDRVGFQIGSGARTINLTSPLPAITQPLDIMGQSQPGYSGAPLIQLNGASAGAGANGLTVNAASCQIEGLVINRFSANGIYINGAGGNIVLGNFIGTDANGATALGNGGAGVWINGSANNIIGGTALGDRNVISGNKQEGVVIAYVVPIKGFARPEGGNMILGNQIGITVAGNAALGNAGDGVLVRTGGNTIGGAGAGNIISANGGSGIELAGGTTILTGSANSNSILGNWIGTSGAGLVAGKVTGLGNALDGIRLDAGASSNAIGGADIAARNVISANKNWGINLDGSVRAVTANKIINNVVGLNPQTFAALPNATGGVQLTNGATGNTIGAANSHNVISGNSGIGILVGGATSTGNVIIGNYVGVSPAGTASTPNGGDGVFVAAGNTQLGGATAGEGNVISGNGTDGVDITAGAGTVLQGNLIGTNAAGTAAVANHLLGVHVLVDGNTIGGATPGAGNIISGNVSAGVKIESTGGTGNIVQGNLIGLAVDGNTVLSSFEGVIILDSEHNTIGGTTALARNVISGNTIDGVVIDGTNATGNTVEGNYIGTNAAGDAAKPNGRGVDVIDASNNIIGGTVVGSGNLISGNTSYGIQISGKSTGDLIQGNLIGTNAAGMATATQPNAALPNGDGINLNAVSGITVGGSTAAARNVISGNGTFGDGVGVIVGDGGSNFIDGNYIGTDAAGIAAIHNLSHGISIIESSGNVIGGTSVGMRNVISGNFGAGISISGANAFSNDVEQNYIGLGADGGKALPNLGGIAIDNAPNNQIGGTTTSARNVISGNQGVAVAISGATSTGNVIEGNYIGTDPTGKKALGNELDAVAISGGATKNTVGGTAAGARNILSANGDNGVFLFGIGTGNNSVIGNYIGTDVTGTARLGNASDGVFADTGASNNTIGGTSPAARNVLSANGASGVEFGTDAGRNILEGNYIGLNAAGTAALGNHLDGVTDDGPNNTVGGLSAGARNVISNNGRAGIAIDGGSGTLVRGNYIGTAANGATAMGNGTSGVLLSGNATKNTIGGTAAGSRNVISGNKASGVELASNASSNLIQGNYIGINATGTGGLGNALDGVRSSAKNNTIGGTSAGARNVISKNGGNGIRISGVGGMVVQGNYIGTAANGTTSLGNAANGLFLTANASNNTIGGTASGAGNLIAFNGNVGVRIDSGRGNAIRRNSIFSNTALGIDLGSVGVTPNDIGDGDSGANDLQNSPVLTSATTTASTIHIVGTLNSKANSTFTIELFSSPAHDASNFGEGKTYLGSITVTTNGSGNASLNATLSVPVPVGVFVTATATNSAANTSEFSRFLTVTSG